MLEIVWEFHAKRKHIQEFEENYSSKGSWARLFGKAAGYRGTTLLQDTENGARYLLADSWDDMAAFQAFKETFAAEYLALDQACEALTEKEICIGYFLRCK